MNRMSAKEYNQIIAPSETKEQITLAGLLDQVKYNGRKLQWAHVPNEGKRSGKTAKILQMMGLKSGLLDILIFDSPPAYPLMKGAALELKKLKGGKVSPEQIEWLDYFNSNSWVAGVAEGLNEALSLLQDWGYIK
ncbi:MAG: hypothetical protein GXY86_08835 [Firmicutes bacterium]|nr:hypothetical protein [Bacillota bacterium]